MKYDPAHLDPRYHAEWSQRYADRAVKLAWVGSIASAIAFGMGVTNIVWLVT